MKPQVIWITGASSGIGRALALEWAKQSNMDRPVKLLLSARRKELLDELVAQIRRDFGAQGAEAESIALDLENFEDFPNIVSKVLNEHGQIDILVNNAGITQRSFATETSLSVYQKLIRVNVLGTIGLTQALLPTLIRQSFAQIVTISSVAGKFGAPYRTGYSASKHALHGYFDSLRSETTQTGLKVTLICPGFVKTEMSKFALMGDGSLCGEVDEALVQGMSTEVFARKAIAAIRARKEEVVIGGAKERLAVYVKRFAPEVFSKIIAKAKVR